MSDELISIVMPVYNAADFLDYSIPSVLSQTYQNIELVIVDDASTDNSYEIIQRYAKLDNRVKAFSIPFVEGPKPARDNAIIRAEGHWIVSVDADDTIEHEYIEKLWQKHIVTGADFVCAVVHVTEKIGLPDLYRIPKESFDLNNLFTGTEAMLRTLPNWEFGVSGALIKRKNITNLFQSPNSLFYNDEVDSRIYLNNSNLVAFSDASYYYVRHPSSSTRNKSVNSLLFDISNYVGLAHYFEEIYGKGNALSLYSQVSAANIFHEMLPLILWTSFHQKQKISSHKKHILNKAYAFFREQFYRYNYLMVQYYRFLMLIVRYIR